MARLIFFLVIFVLGWLAWRKWLAPKPKPTPRRDEFEPMTRCRACGVHLPVDEAIRHDDAHYCCEDHARGDR